MNESKRIQKYYKQMGNKKHPPRKVINLDKYVDNYMKNIEIMTKLSMERDINDIFDGQ